MIRKTSKSLPLPLSLRSYKQIAQYKVGLGLRKPLLRAQDRQNLISVCGSGMTKLVEDEDDLEWADSCSREETVDKVKIEIFPLGALA